RRRLFVWEEAMAKAKDELTAEQVARLNEPGLHRVSCRLCLSIARSGFREWCYRYRWDGQARTTLEKLAKAASSAKDLSKGGRRRETGKQYGPFILRPILISHTEWEPDRRVCHLCT